MWLKHRIDDGVEEAGNEQEDMQSIFLAAYRYALELCENPEIAREVAARFLESIESDDEPVTMPDVGKI